VNTAVQNITAVGLALGFIPVAIVIFILHRWSLNSRDALFAVARMLIQLVLIGYVLGYLFDADSPWVLILILIVMLTAASWIAMRPVGRRNPQLYFRVSISIAIGTLPTLVLITQVVIDIEPWYQPRYLIPLAGMLFASSMNAVSLCAERLESELRIGKHHDEARRTALQAALIPLINSLMAVGLVSLPGMMTGQILSGVEPLVASRYQIVVMCMLFGSSGIAAACYLVAAGRDEKS
jgi:putative ABC transport system permease protein